MRALPLRLLPLYVGIVLLLLTTSTRASGPTTERWYEIHRNGQKLGHSRVVWAPSTWEKRPTLHDTTTTVTRSVREMMGVRDVFETVSTLDLERDDDGTLWWMKTVSEESGRTTVSELTWTGKGYVHVTELDGEVQRIEVPLDEPVMTDFEAFLGSRVRAGKVKPGDRFSLRQLDLIRRSAHVSQLEVLAREDVVDGGAVAAEGAEPVRVSCLKVRERDPESGASTLMWIDDDGAFVRIVAEGGVEYLRVTPEQAKETPVRALQFSVTTPSTPVLERIFSAEHVSLDLHLQGDPDRPLPDFPDSPWSRTLAVEGDDDAGWVVKMQLDAHDVPDAKATIPVEDQRFERHLEATVLMPCNHERLQETARSIVGEETDARRAAELLARWVTETLDKKSPEVAQASALQILEEGRGDCSEHALLFVTLCRAVGIPARSCSGYVNIGNMWGAHAWSEIWAGAWIGADPTTGDVGTAARYVFFGYHDDPKSFPGLVTARSRGRMRFVATRIQEGADDFDLEDTNAWRIHDREHGRYVHVLAGIELRDVPETWVARMLGSGQALVRADGLRVRIEASGDQGYTLDMFGGANTTFAGAPAQKFEVSDRLVLRIHSRRRIVLLVAQGDRLEKHLPMLEKVLAPTFAPSPLPWVPPAEDPASDETGDGEE